VNAMFTKSIPAGESRQGTVLRGIVLDGLIDECCGKSLEMGGLGLGIFPASRKEGAGENFPAPRVVIENEGSRADPVVVAGSDG
jgi:hypothetical protein